MDFNATLTAYGQLGVQLLQDAIAQVEATGKTAQSIRYEVDTSGAVDRLQLIGRAYFSLMEKGIRPSNKNPSPEMIAFLTDYAKARGMKDPEKAAWGIAKTILKEGDQTHKRGGRVVYSDELTKFVEELKTAIAKIYSKQVLAEIKGTFKRGGNS